MGLVGRFLHVFRFRSLDREFDDEIRFHLEERTRGYLDATTTADEARQKALARFGSVERARRGMRAARMPPPIPAALAVGGVVAAVAVFAVRWYGMRVYDLGAGVTPPVPIARSHPEYTSAARRAKIQGTVRIRCVVRPTGACTDLAVVRSVDAALGLDAAALQALRDWRFEPARVRGAPVSARVMIDFTFALR